MNARENESTASSGNVFADIGLPDADERLVKAALAHQLASIARGRHLTQVEAAHILGTSQPKVSDLFSGRLGGFSVERLIRFLNAFDRDVQIVVSPKPKSRERATFAVTGKARAIPLKRVSTKQSQDCGNLLMEA